MARWAIGDVQGCSEELEELLALIHFNSDRDRLWFVGDLVNRGPQSLKTLRLVRSLDANAVCVLGNHDLHLLAVWLVGARLRRHDTLGDVLGAPDRDTLLEWLLQRPLAYQDPAHPELLVHAGLVPQWTVAQTLALAAEVQHALSSDPHRLLSRLYGDKPDRWEPALSGVARLRFAINVCTRLRFCTEDGRINFEQKGPPDSAAAPWLPWYRVAQRASRGQRIVFGHWSALGLHAADGVLGLDTGCVWGGALTAANLDAPHQAPLSVPSRQPRASEE
jgi:bis(5'-nucleosyl)-tetraphosphatase (symmetrical)